MRISKFGVVVASAIAGLVGSAVVTQAARAEEKACYRPHCGKSVSGHEGKCGGTAIMELKTQAACEAAGGAWVTAAEATKFKKKDE